MPQGEDHLKELKKLSVAASDAASFEDCQKAYDAWSGKYDESSQQLGFPCAEKSAEVISRFFGEGEGVNVLDVGTATATMPHHLRTKFNFKGNIDVIDANMSMLNFVSKKKHLNIRTLVNHCVNDDGILPLKDEYYDVLSSTGCFLPNNIKATAAIGFLRALKRGGLLLFNLRPSDHVSCEYNENFEKILKSLEDEGKIKVVEREPTPHCTNWGEKVAAFFIVQKL